MAVAERERRLAGRSTAEFPAVASSLSLVRFFVAEVLAGHARVDDAVWCVSELAANACDHARADSFVVGAHVWPEYARVVVVDNGGGGTVPHVVDAGPGAERGRGLALVSGLASRWGCGHAAPGWLVWCEFMAGSRR